MQGISRLREAMERHKKNKDINIKHKTRLTGGRPTRNLPTPLTNDNKVRNINIFDDEQNIHDACNPFRSSRELRISEWLRAVS